MTTSDAPTLETVELDIRDGVATIALNRPERRNAIDLQMHRDLAAALRLVQRDSSVRALLLTGRGAAFCAGQDLGEFQSARSNPSFRADEHVRTTYNRLATTIRSLEMPVIAAVNGVAAGAGWSLALLADIRIASDDARFTQAFTKIALVPDTGSTWLLTHLVGPSRALELMYANHVIDAQHALEWGLVNEIVPADQLAEHAHAYAARLAAGPTAAFAMTRRAVHRATHTTLEDAIEYEAQLQHRAATSNDHIEGVAAFLDKRDPVFTGR